MAYKQRTLSATVHQISSTFPILLLTGARQVGKTTLLMDCSQSDRRYVTLDDFEQRALAQQDPALFFQANPPPLIIDEVQYAPDLFSNMKLMVDKEKRPGLIWLTGSQKFHLMQGISESLAGRVAILDLLGLSQSERFDRAMHSSPFLPTKSWIEQSQSQPPLSLMSLYEMIWRGSFPSIALNHQVSWDVFYRGYVQTYIQRDVRALAHVGNELVFMRFLRAAAARTGQLINYASMARDVDVDVKTIKSWLSILETSGLIFLLQPYYSNVTNRLVKTPKLYFLDTGLCCYLTQWSTASTLESGAMSGSILETYMLTEILKSYWHNGKTANFYFYRDRDQVEIDLLIEQDGLIYPIEFKKSANPGLQSYKSFRSLDKLNQPIGSGAVICMREHSIPLSRDVTAIPISCF